MSRIPVLTENEMTEPQKRLADKLAASRGGTLRGPGSFWLRNPDLAAAADEFRLHMEKATSLPLIVSELVISVVTRHRSARYAWCRHSAAAVKAGLDPAAIDAIREFREPVLSDPQLPCAYNVTTEIIATTGLSDETYQAAIDEFGLTAFIELVTMVGYGTQLSMAISTFEPDEPEGSDCTLEWEGAPVTRFRRQPRAPRLPPLSTDEMDDAQKTLAETIAATRHGNVSGPFAIWLRTPEIAARADAYGNVLRFQTDLPDHLVELAILLAARYWMAHYAFATHRPLAIKAGIDDAIIEAIETGEMPNIQDPVTKAVYRFVIEVLYEGRASDEVLDDVAEKLGLRCLTELTAVTGFYSMIAVTINAFEAPAPNRIGEGPTG
ncbi:MAG: hypothetical protein O3A84_01295 [Proteobacteria bacterium]|nr:hypothetical protein [Pseudomonadota bacterium]